MRERSWKDKLPGNVYNDINNLFKEVQMEQKSISLQAQYAEAQRVAQAARSLYTTNLNAANIAEAASRQAQAKVEDLAAALGKEKLTDALALIEKVYKEAPPGSAAARDIENCRANLSGLYLAKYVGAILYGVAPTDPDLQKAGPATTSAVKAETSVGVHSGQSKSNGPQHSGLSTCACKHCKY